MAELPGGAGKSFDIDEELSSISQSVLEIYSEIKDTLRKGTKEIESSPSTSVHFQMTSTPKPKDMQMKLDEDTDPSSLTHNPTMAKMHRILKDNLSRLHQITDRTFIPFPIRDKISNPEKIERSRFSCNSEECDGRHNDTTYKSSEVLSKNHISSDFLSEISSLERPITDDKPKSGLHNTRCKKSELKYPFVSFERLDDQQFTDQTLSRIESTGKHSNTQEMESGQLENTDFSVSQGDSSMSSPGTSVSQLTDHSIDLTKADVTYLCQSNDLLKTRDETISEHTLNSPCCSTSKTDHLRHVVPTMLRNENCELKKQFKNMGDRDIPEIKDDGYVLKVQELESYLTKSDQRRMQEQRLKSKTAGIQMALKHLRINEQCLKDENLRYREQIGRLKIEKNLLRLSLAKAEQDGEDYAHEIRTMTDKCEELLIQRKCFQDERNRLSLEKNFLLKEIEDLKMEKKRNAEQIALTTAEKDETVQTLKSTKAMLFTYVKEKQELQFRLEEVLAENSDLRRRISRNKHEQQTTDQSKESWSNEETTERHKSSTLEVKDLN